MIGPAGQAPQTGREKIGFENSSWLMYADYDPKDLRLEVGFKSGKVVTHWPVYPQTWIDWKAAASKGRYYNQAIAKTTQPEEIKK